MSGKLLIKPNIRKSRCVLLI